MPLEVKGRGYLIWLAPARTYIPYSHLNARRFGFTLEGRNTLFCIRECSQTRKFAQARLFFALQMGLCACQFVRPYDFAYASWLYSSPRRQFRTESTLVVRSP
eukprot:6208578-Pleurochrysis_carterae.AAC.1